MRTVDTIARDVARLRAAAAKGGPLAGLFYAHADAMEAAAERNATDVERLTWSLPVIEVLRLADSGGGSGWVERRRGEAW